MFYFTSFLRARGPWKNEEQHASRRADDDCENGVVPNLTMTDDVDDLDHMEDIIDDDDDDDDNDEKTESADVDILSLSPVSSSSAIVPIVESDSMNIVMKEHSPSESMMERIHEHDEDMNRMEDKEEYCEVVTHKIDTFTQLDMNNPNGKTEEETIYVKEPTPQQESLISQLMHTNHLVSPSI